MKRHLALAIVLAALGACNVPVSPLAAPATSTPAPPPVVGHWMLAGEASSERLWIEADGTFTEGGGPALGAGTLSPILSSGSWDYADPTLTFDDARTGAHAFDAVTQSFDTVLILSDAHSYRFDRDSTDAGADH